MVKNDELSNQSISYLKQDILYEQGKIIINYFWYVSVKNKIKQDDKWWKNKYRNEKYAKIGISWYWKFCNLKN